MESVAHNYLEARLKRQRLRRAGEFAIFIGLILVFITIVILCAIWHAEASNTFITVFY